MRVKYYGAVSVRQTADYQLAGIVGVPDEELPYEYHRTRIGGLQDAMAKNSSGPVFHFPVEPIKLLLRASRQRSGIVKPGLIQIRVVA